MVNARVPRASHLVSSWWPGPGKLGKVTGHPQPFLPAGQGGHTRIRPQHTAPLRRLSRPDQDAEDVVDVAVRVDHGHGVLPS
jgi:hypothetical protein